jgi:hypothetical protein
VHARAYTHDSDADQTLPARMHCRPPTCRGDHRARSRHVSRPLPVRRSYVGVIHSLPPSPRFPPNRPLHQPWPGLNPLSRLQHVMGRPVGPMATTQPSTRAVGGLIMSAHDPDFPASIGPLPAWRKQAACLTKTPNASFPSAQPAVLLNRSNRPRPSADPVLSSANACNGHSRPASTTAYGAEERGRTKEDAQETKRRHSRNVRSVRVRLRWMSPLARRSPHWVRPSFPPSTKPDDHDLRSERRERSSQIARDFLMSRTYSVHVRPVVPTSPTGSPRQANRGDDAHHDDLDHERFALRLRPMPRRSRSNGAQTRYTLRVAYPVRDFSVANNSVATTSSRP